MLKLVNNLYKYWFEIRLFLLDFGLKKVDIVVIVILNIFLIVFKALMVLNIVFGIKVLW